MKISDKIKKDAVTSGAHIQDSTGTEIEKVFNQMFYLPKDIEKETAFIKQVMTRGSDSQERVGLHASALIVGEKDFCMREQVLSLLYRRSEEQFSDIGVGLMRIFEEGNAIHEKWQRLFLRAGYAEPKHLDFTQWKEEFELSFTPDVICTLPGFGELLIEIKSVNTFQFKNMIHHPSGRKQLFWYMHLSGIHQGCVLCEDKNTQDFKVQYYEYSPAEVATPLERAEAVQFYKNRVLTENKMVKRFDGATPSHKRCAKCPMRDACYNTGRGRQLIGRI